MKRTPLEIERKYLIQAPERALLDALASRRDYIRQTYLTPAQPGTTERVRLRGCGEGAEYTHTVKRRLTDYSREEREEQISPREYRALLERADPALRTLEKTRLTARLGALSPEKMALVEQALALAVGGTKP